MKLKGFGDDNFLHLSTYYRCEELGEKRKLEREEYLKGLDSKKFKEFMQWKEEMERKFPFIRDALLGRKAPPLHWEVKEDPKKDNIFNNILTKIKDKFPYLFERDCFT